MRNIRDVRVVNFRNLNVFDVFFGGNIVLDKQIWQAERETRNARRREQYRLRKQKALSTQE